MATKSNRSAGSQFTNRGVTQGTTLVGQKSGLPIDEVVDENGVRRLAVDAAITLDTVSINIDDLKPDKDQVGIGDPESGNTLEVEADGSINVNVEIDADSGDNIAIHDSGGDELAINADGSINVNLVGSATGDFKNYYNEVSAVVTGILTTMQTYTVPVGKTAYLQKVDVSGTNIAEYTVLVNSVIQDKKRTYFSGDLNTEFKFADNTQGYPLATGDVVVTKVIHGRPDSGDFNSRIQVIEV